MNKINYESKKGFTLIELLVVIGILAVLAAIAIPSVAGLIDKANASADKTNSNEMTNAMERFASEYELFCQDIASGTFDKNNMDSAQGRVYNVLGIENRAGIELVEINADEPVDDDDIAIFRDTKYPANAKTAQLIVQNYTKTSSSTFEPKQSDMHYWYSPDCGVVVVAEPTKTAAELDKYVISGMDAKGNDITSDGVNAQWIDLTLGATLSGGASLDMSTVDSILANNDWATIKAVIQAGKVNEAGWQVGALSPKFNINGRTNMQARIVDIDSNKVTFMLTSSIGDHNMNASSADYPYGDNIGGYVDSEMKVWLDGEVYNNLDANLKAVISPTTITCSDGYSNPYDTKSATCYLFLPSVREVGLDDDISSWYAFMTAIEAEGETFDYFASSNFIDDWLWLRSSYSNGEDRFFYCSYGSDGNYSAHSSNSVYPVFVIS